MKIAIVSAMVLGLAAPSAFADEPVTLTDTQMDSVTAGVQVVRQAGLVNAGVNANDVADVDVRNVDVGVAVAAFGSGAVVDNRP